MAKDWLLPNRLVWRFSSSYGWGTRFSFTTERGRKMHHYAVFRTTPMLGQAYTGNDNGNVVTISS